MSRHTACLLTLVSWCLVGCDSTGDSRPDAVAPDVSPGPDTASPSVDAEPDATRPRPDSIVDAARPDAALRDSALRDGVLPDGVLPDAALPDAVLPDAALPDAVPRDAALPDAVPPDAVAADAAAPDAAVPDAGPVGLPDLIPIAERLLADIWFDHDAFGAQSCVLDDGCIRAPGIRRLLRMGLTTANIGAADFRMGAPADNPLYDRSECRGRYQFEEYARFGLLDADGGTVVEGGKRAYCLLDSGRWDREDETVRDGRQFGCENQGISRGWYDVYSSGLGCQWLDITDVEPGDYMLRVELNYAQRVPESDYDNNTVEVPVEVPAHDLTRVCPEHAIDGERRSCGWTLAGSEDCPRNSLVTLGCAPTCGLGECDGDPVLRVCRGDGIHCSHSGRIASDSDACGSSCPRAVFECPRGERYTVWTNAEEPDEGHVCNVEAVVEALGVPTEPCEAAAADGLGRECGWNSSVPMPCEPGITYRIGCSTGDMCGIAGEAAAGIVCEGDPLLRVCDGEGPCRDGVALSRDDDDRSECDTQCPLATARCDASGQFTVMTAAYADGEPYRCKIGYEPVVD